MILICLTALLIIVLISGEMCYQTFKVLEAVYELRECKRRNPSGGYYQRWSLAEHLAANYLSSRCEITVKKLPQGGYNVYSYNYNRTLLLPGDSYDSLDD